MQQSREVRAERNILYGILNRLASTILPFLTRTAVIYILGSKYVGLGTLFTSILSFLSLTELGLSSAINYTMYEPFAVNDYRKISALLRLYRKIYFIIGIIILFIGLLFLPILPLMINDIPPEGINIYVLYMIFLFSTVISYFFGGYRQSLLSASQREDVISRIGILMLVFNNVVQILVLLLSKNYYIFAAVPVMGALLNNYLCYSISKKYYPEITCRGKVEEKTITEIKKCVGGLFGTKLNSVVVNQSDTLVISAFLGLETLANYGNYYYVMNAVSSFVIVIFTSLTASVGNKIITDSPESTYTLFKRVRFVNAWVVGFCCTCFVCLYQTFMKIWVGETMLLPDGIVILLALYFFVYQIQRTVLTFKDAAGLWYEDRYRPYVAMILNVLANIVLVQFIGLYGIIISTIISFAISVPWANYVLYHYLFKKTSGSNILFILKWLGMTSIVILVTGLICNWFGDNIGCLILKFLVCCFTTNFLFGIMNNKSDEYKYWKDYIIRRLVIVFERKQSHCK